MGGWDTCLDQLEAELDALRTAPDGEVAVPSVDWAPPTDLGPLPARCRERAEALLRRLRHAVDTLDQRRAEVGTQLSRDRRRHTAARTYRGSGPPAE